MPSATDYCRKCLSGVDELLDGIKEKPWEQYDSVSFSHNLEKTIVRLEDLQQNLQFLRRKIPQLSGIKNAPSVEQQLEGINSHLELLNNNLVLENTKLEKAENKLIHAKSTEPNQNFAELERQIFGLLTTLRHELERLQAYSRRL